MNEKKISFDDSVALLEEKEFRSSEDTVQEEIVLRN